MHASLMHCDRKPLCFYRTVQVGQVLFHMHWVSAHSIQHTYTSTFPIPRDTYISFSAVQLPFLAFAANTEFIHRAPHCCCGTEEKNLSWSSCPFYWRCRGMLWWLQGGRLALFIHRQNHPSTSLATMEAASFYPFSLGATNVKKTWAIWMHLLIK